MRGELLVLNARAIFCLLVFFCWNDFSHKKKSIIRYLFVTKTDKEGIYMKNQNKTKIGVGSVVKSKVGELDKITREGRSRRVRK